jgi:hypothetical protein
MRVIIKPSLKRLIISITIVYFLCLVKKVNAEKRSSNTTLPHRFLHRTANRLQVCWIDGEDRAQFC